MTAADRTIDAIALDWARRIHDPGFVDWDAHLAWLEADPAHAAAFDDAVIGIEEATMGLAPVPAPILSANDNEPTRPTGRWRWGGAIAAMLAVTIGIGSWTATRPGPAASKTQTIAAGRGHPRSVRLADGSRVALNGGTVLRIGDDGRSVALLDGEAFFHVVHDDARPFRVTAGDTVVEDVGTAFNVLRRTDAIEIGVRQGVVAVDPDGARLTLTAGQKLRFAKDHGVVQRVAPATVGGWRTGRLDYRNAALGDVAQDLARAIGEPVAVAGDDAERRFSGTILVDPDDAVTMRRFAAITGTQARRDTGGWRIAAPL